MATLYVLVEGCTDCPFLECRPFGEVHCPYATLPEGVVLDSFYLEPPPPGCPLLDGGTVTLILKYPFPRGEKEE